MTLPTLARRTRSILAVLALAAFMATPAFADDPGSIQKQLQDIQVDALQQDILNDETLFMKIVALQETDIVQDILSDPELMAKIESGDLTALKGDPRIQRLVNHPTVQGMRSNLEQ